MPWSVPKIGTIATVASGNLTLTEPAGIAQGDLMVACIAIRNGVGFANGDWSLIQSQLGGDIDATFGIASGEMWYCVRGASAPSLVFTRTGGDLGHGLIIAYSGAAATPLDTSSSNTLAVASATATTGTITTAEPNELIVVMTSAGDNLTASAFDAATDPATQSNGTDTTTAPTPGTWLERFDAGTNTGADGGLAIADAIRTTAGATGTIQATISNSARHVMIAAAFKMGATTHSGAVEFTGTGTTAFAAVRNVVGAVAFAGAATTAFAGGLVRDGAVSFSGTGTATFTPATAKLETLTDDYDDNSLDSGKWSVTLNGGTVTEQNKRLELAGDANPDEPTVRSTNTYDLAASSGFARISNFEDGGNARFGAEDASGDRYFIRLFGTGITFRKVISSVETQVGGGLTYSPTTHAWLRVRESGGTTFADTAADTADNPPTAGQWTNRWSETTDAGFDPTNVKAYMLLFVASGTNKAIYVDGFNTAANSVLSGAVAYAGAGTFSAAGSVTKAGSVAYAGSATFAAAGSTAGAHSGEVAYDGTGTFAAAATATRPGVVAYAGAGTFNAAATVSKSGTVAYAGAGTFAAAATNTTSGAVAFTGSGTFAADGNIAGGPQSGAVAYTAAATFAASATVQTSGTVAHSATGTFAAAGSVTKVGAVSYAAVGTVGALAGSMSLAGSIAYAASGTFEASGNVGFPTMYQVDDFSGPRYRIEDITTAARLIVDLSAPRHSLEDL